MLQVKEGSQAAFEVLVEKYQGPLTNLIYHLVLDRAEAEELAQEVFLRAYRAASRYRAEAKFSTWLYRIAVNLCLNHLKGRRAGQRLPLEDGFAASEAERPDLQLERRELARLVERALDALPERQRTAVVLHRFEGLSYREIAQAMDCSVEAVEALLGRAKASLGRELARYRGARDT
jgi:RNA polymerase sigma-70 factor (ECF subfamily)